VTFVVDRDRSAMDIARIVRDTGFRPRFDPSAACKDYIDWVADRQDFIAD